MKVPDPRIFQLHADFCRMLANPKRLMIIALLSEQSMNVGEIAKAIDTPLPTVSQHLRALRNKHIVASRKEAQTVIYRATDPRILQACTLIRATLLDGMQERGELARELAAGGALLPA